MGALDTLTAAPFKPTQPAPSSPALSSLTAKPFTPPTPTATPKQSSLATLTSKPFTPPSTTPTPSGETPGGGGVPSTPKYFEGKKPTGTFLGISDQKDPYSGRPFFAYRQAGAPATTTDKTRTAPMVDPEATAPTPRSSFENPRMPESASQAKRLQMGATSEQQLDHRMAISLGGSNADENLKPIPTEENQHAGKDEGSLSAAVASGKMSLFDAQVQEAKNKGLPAPFVDRMAKAGLLDHVLEVLGGVGDATIGGLEDVARSVNTGANRGIEAAKEQQQPKSFSNLGEPALESGWKSLSSTLDDFATRMNNWSAASKAHASLIKQGAAAGEAAVGALNVLFTPITVALATVQGIPGMGQAADLINEIFGAVGGGFSGVGEGAVKNAAGAGLISKDSADTITPLVSEASGLVGMLLAGKAGDEALPQIADKTKAIVTEIKNQVDAIPKDQRGFIKNPLYQESPEIAKAREQAAAIPETHTIDTPERNQLRASIASELYGKGAPKKNARADIVIGLPAAGKSEVVARPLAETHGSLIIDSDAAKEKLPEYKNGLGSSATHLESDKIREAVLNRASSKKDNVVLPLVGKTTLKIKELIDHLKSKGYDVYLHHNDVPIEEAKMRAVNRFRENGRFVDPNYIHEVGSTPKETYATLRTYEGLKGFSQVSNHVTRGEKPVILEHQNGGLPERHFQTGRFLGREMEEPQGTRAGSLQIDKSITADQSPQTRVVPAEEVPPEQSPEIDNNIRVFRIQENSRATNEEDLPREKTQIRWNLPPERGNEAHEGNTPEPISYDTTIAQNNGGVIPPTNKAGNLAVPDIDWTKAKDIAALRLSADTMERNVEKIFGSQADTINGWLTEKVRANETMRAKFVSDTRKELNSKIVKELGIRMDSRDSSLVQLWGEGKMTEEDLMRETKGDRARAGRIRDAAKIMRTKYDEIYNKWNEVRKAYGLSPLGHIDNYFRHFPEFGSFMGNFISTVSTGKIPTAIAGITDYFRSVTPWSSAASRRTGEATKIDAVGGMDNYLNTASYALFHTDSVQRGRLLEKYLRTTAKAIEDTPKFGENGEKVTLQLPNFAQNLNDWTNLVSGKQARLDRAIESVVGRPALAFMRAVIRRFGANVIGGNVSAAATHSIPLVYTLATTDTASAFRGLMATLPKPFMRDLNVIGGQESSFLTRRFMTPSIDARAGEKIARGISAPFRWVDEFISHFAVAAKFEEGVAHGLSAKDAMKEADNYAGRVIGDRSVGNLPNLMNTKTLGLITQFQIEVNDNLRVLMHDVPRWYAGNPGKVAQVFVKFAVYSYMFNQVMQMIKGSGKGLDPINMGLTLAGLNEESRGENVMNRLQDFGTELAGEMPFTSVLTQGQYPALQAIPIADALKGNFGTAAEKFASSFLSPIGGGVQALKTYKGIQAWRAGVVLDASGKVITPIPQTLPTLLQGTAFGTTAFTDLRKTRAELQKLSDLIKLQQATGKAKNQQAAAIWTDIKSIQETQGNDAAEAQMLSIADQDPDMAQRVLTVMKNDQAGITKQDTMLKSLGVKNGQRAAYIKRQLDDMKTNEEKQKYLLDLAEKKILTQDVLSQVLEQ